MASKTNKGYQKVKQPYTNLKLFKKNRLIKLKQTNEKCEFCKETMKEKKEFCLIPFCLLFIFAGLVCEAADPSGSIYLKCAYFGFWGIVALFDVIGFYLH